MGKSTQVGKGVMPFKRGMTKLHKGSKTAVTTSSPTLIIAPSSPPCWGFGRGAHLSVGKVNLTNGTISVFLSSGSLIYKTGNRARFVISGM